MMNDTHLTKQELKERGWTETLINRFLCEPDKRTKNKWGGQTNLYERHRVYEVEALPAFYEAKHKAARRSQAAKQVAKRKEDDLLQQVEEMPINVRCIRDVQAAAIRAYNEHNAENNLAATEDSDRIFLERITVNFIRHELTDYDRQLEDVAAQIGATKARKRIKTRVLIAIAQAYPWLEHECKCQVPQ